MTSRLVRRAALCSVFALFIFVSFLMTACSSSGVDGACTTCPVPTNAALRMSVEFDAFSSGLEPSAFRFHDLSRIEIAIEGGSEGRQTLQLTPPQDAAFLDVHSGNYTISATGYLGTDLILFTAGPQSVTVVEGDTVDVPLDMVAALGEVVFEVAGQRTGTIHAVAGQDVPFVVSVKNTQGRPVPTAAIVVTSTTGFGTVQFEGTNDTDAEGRIRGSVRALQSGTMGGFEVRVDGRPVPLGSNMQVQFASAVDASRSDIVTVSRESLIPADGADGTEFTILVQDVGGNPLAGVPVLATSSRNEGVDKNVDVFVPLPGYESGKTDNFGRFAFAIRSTTSSFMEFDAQGRLFSRTGSGTTFHSALIRVIADGIQIDQRPITFQPVTNSTGASMTISPQFRRVGESAEIEVRVNKLPQFGGGPAVGVFVELTNALFVSQNYLMDIRPAGNFNGFRTNAQGVWRGTIRSTTAGVISLEAKADGRALTGTLRNVIFQP